MARALVDAPDDVVVTEAGAVLHLKVSPADLGKVIGRQGRTARSLRTILTAAASKANKQISLEIVEG